jgi:hypothetical protein
MASRALSMVFFCFSISHQSLARTPPWFAVWCSPVKAFARLFLQVLFKLKFPVATVFH